MGEVSVQIVQDAVCCGGLVSCIACGCYCWLLLCLREGNFTKLGPLTADCAFAYEDDVAFLYTIHRESKEILEVSSWGNLRGFKKD